MSEDENLLTQKELCARWCCSRSKVEQMRVKGDGPRFIKIGRNVFYKMRDVLDYEARNTKQSTAE